MKRVQSVTVIWLSIIILTALTLYLAFVKFLVEPFTGLFLVIEGTMIAELTLLKLSGLFKKPTIILKPTYKMSDVGFYVKVKNKNIRDAKVFCDDTHIKWREKDGTEKEKRDLHVGDIAFFYPFKIVVSEGITSKFTEENKQCILVTIKQKMVTYGQNFTDESDRSIYHEQFMLHKGAFGSIKIKKSHYWFPKFHCNIRMTGEGIEDEIDTWFDAECTFCFSRYNDTDNIDDIWVRCDFEDYKLVI